MRPWFAAFLLAVAAAAHAQSALPAADYFASVKAELRKNWPTNRTINVVCHGHSVPAGYFKTPEVRTMDAYPHLLHEQLSRRYSNAVINVIVTAIGGENSASGAKRFERDVLSLRPEVVLIDYALNDRRLSLEQAEAAWTGMIEAAKGRGVKVILLTPTADGTAKLLDPEDPLNQHAEQVRRLAKRHEVALVDSLRLFQEHVRAGGKVDDLLSQSNHPNRRGHELVAAGIARLID